MSDSLEGLQRQLTAAGDLKSVVRAMKALAASSLGQYEKSVLSLRDYYRTVELGLRVCLRLPVARALVQEKQSGNLARVVVIFGSDQGLVGQFNEIIADFLQAQFPASAGAKIFAIGERVSSCLVDRGYAKMKAFDLPNSIQAVAPLIGRILVALESFHQRKGNLELHIFHHRPKIGAAYDPTSRRLLPVDEKWSQPLTEMKWPTNQLPEMVGSSPGDFQALLQEYLFVCLFQACAESLASENASRLVGMQRAEKNIDELSADLTRRFHRLRQSSIDEELFDVVSGFEAVSPQRRRTPA